MADRPIIWHIPEEVGTRITIHEHWGVDFAGETMTADSEEEARAKARRRWTGAPEPIVYREGEVPRWLR